MTVEFSERDGGGSIVDEVYQDNQAPKTVSKTGQTILTRLSACVEDPSRLTSTIVNVCHVNSS